MVICDGQGLDDDDARALHLVSAGGARGGGRGCCYCCDEGGCDLWLCY
jgi:hypothetical protein